MEHDSSKSSTRGVSQRAVFCRALFSGTFQVESLLLRTLPRLIKDIVPPTGKGADGGTRVMYAVPRATGAVALALQSVGVARDGQSWELGSKCTLLFTVKHSKPSPDTPWLATPAPAEVGKTLVFFKQEAFEKLQAARLRLRNKAATTVSARDSLSRGRAR